MLRDPCVLDSECLARWIADPDADDVDRDLLVAHDAQGNAL